VLKSCQGLKLKRGAGLAPPPLLKALYTKGFRHIVSDAKLFLSNLNAILIIPLYHIARRLATLLF